MKTNSTITIQRVARGFLSRLSTVARLRGEFDKKFSDIARIRQVFAKVKPQESFRVPLDSLVLLLSRFSGFYQPLRNNDQLAAIPDGSSDNKYRHRHRNAPTSSQEAEQRGELDTSRLLMMLELIQQSMTNGNLQQQPSQSTPKSASSTGEVVSYQVINIVLSAMLLILNTLNSDYSFSSWPPALVGTAYGELVQTIALLLPSLQPWLRHGTVRMCCNESWLLLGALLRKQLYLSPAAASMDQSGMVPAEKTLIISLCGFITDLLKYASTTTTIPSSSSSVLSDWCRQEIVLNILGIPELYTLRLRRDGQTDTTSIIEPLIAYFSNISDDSSKSGGALSVVYDICIQYIDGVTHSGGTCSVSRVTQMFHVLSNTVQLIRLAPTTLTPSPNATSVTNEIDMEYISLQSLYERGESLHQHMILRNSSGINSNNSNSIPCYSFWRLFHTLVTINSKMNVVPIHRMLSIPIHDTSTTTTTTTTTALMDRKGLYRQYMTEYDDISSDDCLRWLEKLVVTRVEYGDVGLGVGVGGRVDPNQHYHYSASTTNTMHAISTTADGTSIGDKRSYSSIGSPPQPSSSSSSSASMDVVDSDTANPSPDASSGCGDSNDSSKNPLPLNSNANNILSGVQYLLRYVLFNFKFLDVVLKESITTLTSPSQPQPEAEIKIKTSAMVLSTYAHLFMSMTPFDKSYTRVLNHLMFLSIDIHNNSRNSNSPAYTSV